MNFLLRAIAAVSLIFVTGCAGFAPGKRPEVASLIAEDAVAFNQAYADAVNGMILLNVLRARDRMPRYYMVMSGISDAPSRESSFEAGLGGIGLGNIDGDDFAVGTVKGSAKLTTRPSYELKPYADDKLAKALLSPIDANVFMTFSDTGWHPDFLLEVLAERISEKDVTVSPAIACTKTDNRRDMIACILAQGPRRISAKAAPCEPIGELERKSEGKLDKAYFEAAEKARSAGFELGKNHQVLKCDSSSTIMISVPSKKPQTEKTYDVELRSLDRVIYTLGEVLRVDGDAYKLSVTDKDEYKTVMPSGCARLLSATAQSTACQDVPTFIVYDHAEKGVKYAASITYGGKRYFAGPATDIPDLNSPPRLASGETPSPSDRTTTTLTLLSQIMFMMQTPESVAPPSRTFIETQ